MSAHVAVDKAKEKGSLAASKKKSPDELELARLQQEMARSNMFSMIALSVSYFIVFNFGSSAYTGIRVARVRAPGCPVSRLLTAVPLPICAASVCAVRSISEPLPPGPGGRGPHGLQHGAVTWRAPCGPACCGVTPPLPVHADVPLCAVLHRLPCQLAEAVRHDAAVKRAQSVDDSSAAAAGAGEVVTVSEVRVTAVTTTKRSKCYIHG